MFCEMLQIRNEDEVAAMSWNQRLRKRVKNVFRFRAAPTTMTGTSPDEEAIVQNKQDVQYRLEATHRQKRQSCLRRLWTCNFGSGQTGLSAGVNPNQKLALYLHWMFRVNFLFLFIVMCLTFFALVVLFSGFITIAGRMDAECIRVGDNSFGNSSAPFADAFSLSWQTFSTVGYGSIYPALGYQNNNPSNCFFINFICSLEGLFGVLYSGFCGAILFGKVLRIQSHAQVIFSDPLLVRYGSGLHEGEDCISRDIDENGVENAPCPVLEFRIVNRLFNEPGGEIMDATLNVVANINASDADPSIREALGKNETGSMNGGAYTDNGSEDNDYSISESTQRSTDTSAKNSIARFFGPIGRTITKSDHQAVDEDPSARFVNKHIFSKVMIEAGDHPFFKRVWLARHVLDEHSPILKPRVRRLIRRNGGSWPENLNSYEGIRESLQFNQILVSLNGVSNISASDVYAQKI
jgi:hypothetical protein